ncbi:MAG: hypothetical protein KC583_12820, partial [Myxococcales bacterium]|nr:hypothetical protein [Myxococcales bacterium]
LSLPVTTVPGNGDFRGIGYLGATVALYLDPDRAPANRADAVSAVLDRETLAANGGAMAFSGFFDTTNVVRNSLTFTWAPVETDRSPPVDLCRLEVVRSMRPTYDPGDCTNLNRVDAYDLPNWTAYVAGDAGTMTLPSLPNTWPLAATAGFIDPRVTPEEDRLDMRISCYGLSLLPDFDFNATDFGGIVQGLTHVSSHAKVF